MGPGPEANFDLGPPLEVRRGTEFICNLCCPEGQLFYCTETDCVVWHCEAHITVRFRDGRVIGFTPRGTRQ